MLEYSLVYHTPEQSDGSSGHVVQLRGVASMAFTDDWAQVAPANPVVAVAKAVQQAAGKERERRKKRKKKERMRGGERKKDAFVDKEYEPVQRKKKKK